MENVSFDFYPRLFTVCGQLSLDFWTYEIFQYTLGLIPLGNKCPYSQFNNINICLAIELATNQNNFSMSNEQFVAGIEDVDGCHSFASVRACIYCP
ncbi:hypothetical protein GBA52_008152 [Prunus armeniaca]|nr:hypothetical protein GBA52_008152 [Prunus armeniaca]